MSYSVYLLADAILGLITSLAIYLFPDAVGPLAVGAGTLWMLFTGMRMKHLGWTLWLLSPCALMGMPALSAPVAFAGAIYSVVRHGAPGLSRPPVMLASP